MEFNNSTQEDVLERLASAEKLIVELKDVIRQKDVELQQKDEALQVLLFLSFLAEHLIKIYTIHLDFSLFT
jgi:uncharacterized protein YbaP (TraB family)